MFSSVVFMLVATVTMYWPTASFTFSSMKGISRRGVFFLRTFGSRSFSLSSSLHQPGMFADDKGVAERVGKDYNFSHLKLPMLAGSNNFYSGTYRDCFWHQNADQVFVHVPLKSDMSPKDIRGKFEVYNVSLTIHNSPFISFTCPERIIPHGSFWTVEKDIYGKTYIQLDLEKRFRMLNWNSLFGRTDSDSAFITKANDVDLRKSRVLQTLLDANEGLSKITGLPPETISDMMKNEELLNKIVNAHPEPIKPILDAVEQSNMSVPFPEVMTKDQAIINILENKGIKESLESFTLSDEDVTETEEIETIDSSWKEIK